MHTLGLVIALSVLMLAALPPEPCAARTYSTVFPVTESPIAEGDHWIDGKTDGLDWADVETAAGLAFGTQSGTAGYDDATALLTGEWGPDQSVEATVHSVNEQTDANVWEEVEIRLRSSISANSCVGYEILFELPPHNFCQVVRWNGPLGDWTSLGYLGNGVHNGDVVKASVVANAITVYVNGVSQGQVTDSTYSSGSPGMGFYLQGATGVNGDYGFTSLEATDGLPSEPTSPASAIASVLGRRSMVSPKKNRGIFSELSHTCFPMWKEPIGLKRARGEPGGANLVTRGQP